MSQTPPRRPRVRVSRQGFTRCASCGRHIRLAASVAATVCPFCNASLAAAPTAGNAGWVARGARGSLLAAGLLGALACESIETAGATPDTAAGDATTADVSDSPNDAAATDSGAPGDDVGDPVDDGVEPADDVGPQPEYGAPPADVVEPEDIPVAPLYGGPPADDVTEPPADITEVPEDVPVAPLYGGPPADDVVEPEDTTHPDDDAGPGPMPLYGLPPSPPR